MGLVLMTFDKKKYNKEWVKKNSVHLKEYQHIVSQSQRRKDYEKARWKIRSQKPERKLYTEKWKKTEAGKRCKEKMKIWISNWFKSQTGKMRSKIYFSRRHRLLGYDLINPECSDFDNYEGHHIDKVHVVFIPKVLHRSVWHSQDKPETMVCINTKIFCWLLGMEVI
jgi:hypothetical protein